MNTRNLLATGGVAALSLALIALPAPPANSQTPCPDDSAISRLERKLERLQARLQGREDEVAKLTESRAMLTSQMVLAQHHRAIEQLEAFPQLAGGDDDVKVLLDDEGSSWLGVELREVNGDTAKELKLPAERGVVLSSIVPDSPAAKAGLKENDVVTEINGQRVEGAAQFRRVIRIPMVPSMEWDGSRFLMGGSPRLGIDAEDLTGQLGTFFGAPDGEGILVREVNPGSAAEKAGVKAGDVITSVNGQRVRTVGDLREKLTAKREAKDKDQNQSVKLGVLRNKSEVSLTVELPPPASRTKRFISHRTNI